MDTPKICFHGEISRDALLMNIQHMLSRRNKINIRWLSLLSQVLNEYLNVG